MDTRGWMGGVSRRAILSIKPETFFRAVFGTSLKIPRSLSRKCVKGYTLVEALSSCTYPAIVGTKRRFDRLSGFPVELSSNRRRRSWCLGPDRAQLRGRF